MKSRTKPLFSKSSSHLVQVYDSILVIAFPLDWDSLNHPEFSQLVQLDSGEVAFYFEPLCDLQGVHRLLGLFQQVIYFMLDG